MTKDTAPGDDLDAAAAGPPTSSSALDSERPEQPATTSSLSVLRLLHLSDIHFVHLLPDHQRSLDLEHAVRARMLLDISNMRDSLGPMDAILVVGDIAFGGRPEQYDVAAEFLHGVAELIGCPNDKVVCVPGNHDVDWTQHDLSHEALRQQLRNLPPERLSDKLLALLGSEPTCDTLLRPFDAYNAFALAYACDISHDVPVWAPKTFPLGPRTVQVHGVTSAWISDVDDSADDDSYRLVAGVFQAASIGTDPEVISIAMCHHPPGWLRDRDLLSPWLNQARLVLTGHEHVAGTYLSGDERTLHVASGAVNPSRVESPWAPAYNVLELYYDSERADILRVRVHTQTWQERAEFGPDTSAKQPREFLVRLVPRLRDETPRLGGQLDADSKSRAPEPIDSARHRHAYAVMRASRDLRRSMAREMGLLADPAPIGLAADRAILLEAIRSGRLSELAANLVGGTLDDAG